jgi:hypothetical protein
LKRLQLAKKLAPLTHSRRRHASSTWLA